MPQQDTLVTDSSLEAFLHCRYKSYLTINCKIGQPSDFERHTSVRNDAYRRLVQSQLSTQHRETDVLHRPATTFHILQKGKLLILDAKAKASSLSATIDALQRAGGTSLLGDFLYQPIQLCYHESPIKITTILLAFKSLVIGELQGQVPTHGTVIFGSHLNYRKVKLQGLQKRVRRLITNIQTYTNANTVPPLILNQHCSVCEYRTFCRNEAVASDNLSLLGGMTEREISSQNRKGIFTVNQLSYTFRYRKPSKRAKRPAKPHQFSLQALALRTQKVHIHGTLNLAVADPAIYFDIEGLSNPRFYYLIGILLIHQDHINYRSFWADSEREQASMFQQFADAVTDIPNIRLFHFGNYDRAALKHACRICEPRYAAALDRIVKASTNVLTLINSQVYFPTYSNSLKDIASYLGFKWTDANASGIQSIIWHDQWTLSGDLSYKRKLIEYNQEDCVALMTICDFIRSKAIAENQPRTLTCEHSNIVFTKELSKPSHIWGRPVFALENLERASTCAYFDYQREHVFVRTSRKIAKAEKANKKKDCSLPVNKRIEVSCKRCSHCKSKKIHPYKRVFRHVSDLRFSSAGVKRWVVRYESSRYQCQRCGKTFLPEDWPSWRSRYGVSLAKWCVYLNFACKH